jgi:AcrR family transcriptional regulator
MPIQTSPRKRVAAAERRRLLVDAAGQVFAEHGYQGTAVEAIARRAGVTVPVLYDHFASKGDLYVELVEHHYASLREIWSRHASGGDELAVWLGPAVGEWFAYVEAHPFARRMLFHEATRDPAAAEAHRRIQDASRVEVIALLRRVASAHGVDFGDDVGVELAWEALRAVLQGLALWWHERPDVPRARIVDTAMNAIWLGFERILAGERWNPSAGATRD